MMGSGDVMHTQTQANDPSPYAASTSFTFTWTSCTMTQDRAHARQMSARCKWLTRGYLQDRMLLLSKQRNGVLK